MNAMRSRSVNAGFVVLALVLVLNVTANATRIGIVGESLSGDVSVAVPGFGTPTVDLDSSLYGIAFASPLGSGEHWEFSMALLYGQLDYEVFGTSLSGILETDMLLVDHNISYRFGSAAVQPVVTGGVGYGLVKNEILSLALSETNFDFTYNFGAGAVWSISDAMTLQAMYTMRNIMDDVDYELDGFSLAFYWQCN